MYSTVQYRTVQYYTTVEYCTESHLGLGTMLDFKITVYGAKNEYRHFNLRDENVHATKKSCRNIVRDKKNTVMIYTAELPISETHTKN